MLLNGRDPPPLTEDEIAAGWHYCYEWDFLLVGPGTDEWDGCPESARSRSGLTGSPMDADSKPKTEG